MAQKVKAKWNTVVPVGAGNSILHFASSCRLNINRIVVGRVTVILETMIRVYGESLLKENLSEHHFFLTCNLRPI